MAARKKKVEVPATDEGVDSNTAQQVDLLSKYHPSSDVYLYVGQISRSGYEAICEAIRKRKNRRQKGLLVLSTVGGDPDAGYRIARAFIHHYGSENFEILIPYLCKSAGTLICIGAGAIRMCDQGELGPLDIQLSKQNELFGQSSGLDIMRGLAFLKDDVSKLFRDTLFGINGLGSVSTKTSAEIATQLVTKLFEPITAQIDPMKLGEMNATINIANDYGKRLDEKSQSLQKNALSNLIYSYPTHGFVIDRAEARQIFKNVSAPTEEDLLFLNEHAKVSNSRFASNDIPIVL